MRRTVLCLIPLIVVVISWTAVGAELGQHCCCAHCGCQAQCQKQCRLVCEDKKVEVTCFGCLCEPFCVPGPSCPSCQHCECLCASCDTKGDGKTPYAAAKPFLWSEWIPNPCATMFTRKKLMKKTETVTVKSYKWVVEDVCKTCEAKSVGADVVAGAQVPEPPIQNVVLKVGAVAR